MRNIGGKNRITNSRLLHLTPSCHGKSMAEVGSWFRQAMFPISPCCSRTVPEERRRHGATGPAKSADNQLCYMTKSLGSAMNNSNQNAERSGRFAVFGKLLRLAGRRPAVALQQLSVIQVLIGESGSGSAEAAAAALTAAATAAPAADISSKEDLAMAANEIPAVRSLGCCRGGATALSRRTGRARRRHQLLCLLAQEHLWPKNTAV